MTEINIDTSLYPPMPSWKFHAIVSLLNFSSAIEGVIKQMSDSEQIVARAKFNWVDYFHRDDPLILAIASAMGLSEQEINDIWNQGHALE